MNNILRRLHHAFAMCVDVLLRYCWLKIYRSRQWTSLWCCTFLQIFEGTPNPSEASDYLPVCYAGILCSIKSSFQGFQHKCSADWVWITYFKFEPYEHNIFAYLKINLYSSLLIYFSLTFKLFEFNFEEISLLQVNSVVLQHKCCQCCFQKFQDFRLGDSVSCQVHYSLLQSKKVIIIKCDLFPEYTTFDWKRRGTTEIWQIISFYQKPPINMVGHIYHIVMGSQCAWYIFN